MARPEREDVSSILRSLKAGEEGAEVRLFDAVYQELRRIAGQRRAGEASGHSFQTTELVHEAYLRLAGDEKLCFESRAHFFSAAAEAMRRILIDRARMRKSLKRGGGHRRVPLEDDQVAAEDSLAEFFLELDDVLSGIEKESPRMGQVVKMRYFLGLSVGETAKILDVSPRTVKSHCQMAKARIRRAVGD